MILGSFRAALGSLGAQLGGLWNVLAADALVVPETLEAINVSVAVSSAVGLAFASSAAIDVALDVSHGVRVLMEP